ncbi:hypothetical protein DERP_008121 [Dermatophagoides pteronyssinus]|uniref:Uncharacterized protein n=1 Tax=Dermatophagoides pteronyssinus TaxID=6956 RepID=A0ABQ8JJU1_DERPT|nr:hypothetical protein DERP_008121 [Dermatophagoides pteronyssinus]
MAATVGYPVCPPAVMRIDAEFWAVTGGLVLAVALENLPTLISVVRLFTFCVIKSLPLSSFDLFDGVDAFKIALDNFADFGKDLGWVAFVVLIIHSFSSSFALSYSDSPAFDVDVLRSSGSLS